MFNFIKIFYIVLIENIRIIHSHGRGALIYIVLLKIIFRKKIKTIYTIHGFNVENIGEVTKYFYLILEKFASKILDKIIFVSNSEYLHYKDIIKTKNKENTIIINNFVEDNKNKITIYKKRNEFKFIAVGRFSKQKGFDILIEAFGLLEKHYPNKFQYKVFIVGEGKEKEYLADLIRKNNISDKIFIRNSISNVKKIFYLYDALIIPSRFEGMPLTLLEAINIGIPVIATPARGIIDVIDDNNSFICKSIDSISLYQKILEFIYEDEKIINKKIIEAKKRYYNCFSIRNINKIIYLYKNK